MSDSQWSVFMQIMEESKNYKVDEFTNKLGLRIEFGPAYSPWSNRVNERNHYCCDMIIKKIKKILR